MVIIVVDGAEGAVGKTVIECLRKVKINDEITAIGTNPTATSAMLKAGANLGATGEKALIGNCKRADYIIGPVGIVFANSMRREVTPQMAAAVASSPAHKLLIPDSSLNASIMGVAEKPLMDYIAEMVKKIIREMN